MVVMAVTPMVETLIPKHIPKNPLFLHCIAGFDFNKEDCPTTVDLERPILRKDSRCFVIDNLLSLFHSKLWPLEYLELVMIWGRGMGWLR
jgi:hypothetical protein